VSEFLQQVPLYQSLTKPVLVAGVEKEYLLVLLIFSICIWMVGLNVAFFIIALSFWVIGMAIGRFLAKKDAMMMNLLIRHIKHRDYYLGREKPIIK